MGTDPTVDRGPIEASGSLDRLIDQRRLGRSSLLEACQATPGLEMGQDLAHHIHLEHGRRIGERVSLDVGAVAEVGAQAGPLLDG